jgi:pimeloyl-ACP methyl ester carboxylesterase
MARAPCASPSCVTITSALLGCAAAFGCGSGPDLAMNVTVDVKGVVVRARELGSDCTHELLAEYMRLVIGADLADQQRVIERQLRAVASYDASDRLHRLAFIPTLVVSATEDRIAPPACGQALAGAIPGARYLEVPEAAHGLAIQCAALVNRLLAEHFGAAERPRLLAAVS